MIPALPLLIILATALAAPGLSIAVDVLDEKGVINIDPTSSLHGIELAGEKLRAIFQGEDFKMKALMEHLMECDIYLASGINKTSLDRFCNRIKKEYQRRLNQTNCICPQVFELVCACKNGVCRVFPNSCVARCYGFTEMPPISIQTRYCPEIKNFERKKEAIREKLRGKIPTPGRGIADPAAVYCERLGYRYVIEKVPGGQRGVCVFNGEKCDTWEFLKGTCGLEHTFCAKHGGTIKIIQGRRCKYTQTCVLCKIGDKECTEWEWVMGLC